MFRKKIIPFFAVIVAIIAAFGVYHNFHPENFLQEEHEAVTLKEFQEDKTGSYIGYPAGDDIPRLQGKEEFENSYVNGVTVETKKIIATDVGSRKAWESPYTTSGTKRYKRKVRKADEQKGWDLLDYYNEYYLIECPDGSYILAQMPDRVVKEIKKGKTVTLPICKKNGLTQRTKDYLTEICEKYDASMEGALYAFDDTWYEEHSLIITILRLGAAVVAFFVIGVALLLLLEKIFPEKNT